MDLEYFQSVLVIDFTWLRNTSTVMHHFPCFEHLLMYHFYFRCTTGLFCRYCFEDGLFCHDLGGTHRLEFPVSSRTVNFLDIQLFCCWSCLGCVTWVSVLWWGFLYLTEPIVVITERREGTRGIILGNLWRNGKSIVISGWRLIKSQL